MYLFPARGLRHAALFLFAIASTAPMFAQGAKVKTPGKWIEESGERREDERSFSLERRKWFMKGRQAPAGETPAGARIKAFRQKQAMHDANELRFKEMVRARLAARASRFQTKSMVDGAALDGPDPSAPNSGLLSSTPAFNHAWTPLGPTPIGRENSFYGDVTGRVTAIAIDQTDTTGNTVYVGGAYGGVWKSTNAANAVTDNITWTPLTDTQVSLAANAIAISPANSSIILVGTGEPDFAGDSYYGAGILRSSNAGTTWALISHDQPNAHQFKGMGISKFAWSTSNTNLVVAGFSNGSVVDFGSNPGGNQGIYYSIDAGVTWNKAVNNTPGDTVFGSVSDVVYNSTANKFFAALRNEGIYSSADGANWTRLVNQPFGLGACSNTTSCFMLRASLASRAGANEIYAIGIDGSGTGLMGIARSLNGGAWTALDPADGIDNCGDPGGCGAGQGFYDLTLNAVPNGTDTDLYVGMVNLYRCPNAATTTCNFSNVTHVYNTNPLGMHPDYHSFDYLQSSPITLYIGNDGGLYRSQSGLVGTGTAGAQNLNAHLGSLSQFVSMSQHPTNKDVLLGGLQDNGSPARDSSHFNDITGSTQQTWVHIAGGDGGYNAINQTSPNLWSQEYVYVTIGQCDSSQAPGSDANGTTGGCIPNALPAAVVSANGAGYLGATQNFSDEGQFYTTFILDPANQSKLIIGTCRVWRGNADGTGWVLGSLANALSNRLFSNDTNFCAGANDPSEPGVKALAAGGPKVGGLSSVIYAGFDNGQLFVTTNSTAATPTWTDRTGSWGTNPVADIAILGGNSGTGLTAFAVTQNFQLPHVWKTTTGGASWVNISGNLPDVPASSIAIDPTDATGKTLYVGTDLGVFYTIDGGATWVEYGPASGAGALPNAPVTRLLAFNVGGQHLLRASTYGRGVWQNTLAVAQDFSIAISNSPLTAFANQHKTFNGTLSFLNGYAGTVTLSCTSAGTAPPATCNATPSSTATAGAFTVDVADPGTGTFNFKIRATDGSNTHDFPVTLHVNDYSISVTSAQPTVLVRGNSAIATVKVQSSGSFNAPVTISCPTPPGGVSCTPVTVTPPAGGSVNANLTVAASTVATVHAYTITLNGATAGATRTAPLQIDLQENSALFDFTIAVTPASRTVLPGGSAVYSVSMSPLGGFNSTVNLTCLVVTAPAGSSCSFDQTGLDADSVSHLTVNTTGATPAATYTVQVTGTAGTRIHSKNVTLIVNTSDFTMNGAPTVTVTRGDKAGTAYPVTLNSVGGFASPVFVTCGGLPTDIRANADVFCSSGGSTIPTGATVNIILRAGGGTTAGSYSIQIIGYSLSPYLVHTIPVTLTVQ